MGFLNWILFWSDTYHNSILYHIIRQSAIIGLFVVAVLIFPTTVSMYLLTLSIIEYTRKCSGMYLIILYCFFVFVTWFTGFLYQPFEDQSHPRITILDLLRGMIYVMAVAFDRLTTKRFGIVSNITLLAFPTFLVCSSEFISVIDQFGISIHVAAFCNYFPDVSFLPLRLVGPNGLAFCVGFLASYTSMWRVARHLARRRFRLHIRWIPIVIGGVVISNFIFARTENTQHISVIQNFDQTNIKKVYDQIKSISNSTPFILVDLPLIGDVTKLLSIKSKSLITFCATKNGSDTLYVLDNGKSIEFPLYHHQKSKVPFLYKMRDVLVVNTTLGRTAFLVGRDVLFAEFFASQDFDLIISYGGSEYDEKAQLMQRTGPVISSSTGAYHFHASAFANTYLIRGNGHTIFSSTPTKEDVRVFDISSNGNRVFQNKFKFIFFAYFFHVIGSLWILLNFIPYYYVRNFTQVPRGIVLTIQDST